MITHSLTHSLSMLRLRCFVNVTMCIDVYVCIYIYIYIHISLQCYYQCYVLFIRMNPREPAATARRPLRIGVLAKRAAERLVHSTVKCGKGWRGRYDHVIPSFFVRCSAKQARRPMHWDRRITCGSQWTIGKRDSIHHHLLEVNLKTATVLESRQSFYAPPPLGGGGGITSVCRRVLCLWKGCCV